MNESSIERHSLIKDRCLTCGSLLPCALHDREMKREILREREEMPGFEKVWEKSGVRRLFLMGNELVYEVGDNKLCRLSDVHKPENVQPMPVISCDGWELDDRVKLYFQLDELHLMTSSHVLGFADDKNSFIAEGIRFKNIGYGTLSDLAPVDDKSFVGVLYASEEAVNSELGDNVIADRSHYFVELRQDEQGEAWTVNAKLLLGRGGVAMYPMGANDFICLIYGDTRDQVDVIHLAPLTDQGTYQNGIGDKRHVRMIHKHIEGSQNRLYTCAIANSRIVSSDGDVIKLWFFDRDTMTLDMYVASFQTEHPINGFAPSCDGGFFVTCRGGDVWQYSPTSSDGWAKKFILHCEEEIGEVRQVSATELLVQTANAKLEFWSIPADKLKAYHERQAQIAKVPELPSDI